MIKIVFTTAALIHEKLCAVGCAKMYFQILQLEQNWLPSCLDLGALNKIDTPGCGYVGGSRPD